MSRRTTNRSDVTNRDAHMHRLVDTGRPGLGARSPEDCGSISNAYVEGAHFDIGLGVLGEVSLTRRYRSTLGTRAQVGNLCGNTRTEQI